MVGKLKEVLTLSPRALDRYLVVSRVEAKALRGVPLVDAIAQALQEAVCDHRGRPMRLSGRTIHRWLSAFRHDGLAGLEPAAREAAGASLALSERLLGFFEQEKTSDEAVSVPEMIRHARAAGVIGEGEPVSRVSAWRACRRLELPLRRAHAKAASDMRRYAYPNRMLCVLADGTHFRAGARRAKRVAMILLDDASRYGLSGVVGTSESTVLFLMALDRTLRRYGLMLVLYLDHGSGFISDDTRAVLARLGIRLILGTEAYPEGHGKIERFNRTAKERLLRSLAGRPEVDPDCGALTLRLTHWLETGYNRSPHESLGLQTPFERFTSDPRPLTFPESPAWLASRFLLSFTRKVSNDNIVTYGPTAFEVPIGHAGTRITITRHLLEGNRLTIIHEGREVTLAPVDLVANAYARRGRRGGTSDDDAAAGESAATSAFDHDLGPITSPEGDYPGDDDDE
jgi:transposase InsO family protein